MSRKRPIVKRLKAVLSIEAFDKLVQEAIAELPQPYDRLVEEVSVVVEEEPPAEVLNDLNIEMSDDLLGLYQGLSLADQSFFQPGGHQPPRISIYRGPIMRQCSTVKEIMQEIRDTVVHELGHHVGLDDTEMPY